MVVRSWGRVVQVCEVIAGGKAHPGVACGHVLGQAEGVIEASVLEVRRALLAIGEAGLVERGVGREGGMLLDWQLFLYEVGQGLPCDVKWVEAEVIVLLLLLLLGRRAKTEGRLPISGWRHWDSVCKRKKVVGLAPHILKSYWSTTLHSLCGPTWSEKALWFWSHGPVGGSLWWTGEGGQAAGDGVGMSEIAVVWEKRLRLCCCPLEGWARCEFGHADGHNEAGFSKARWRRWGIATGCLPNQMQTDG